MFPLHPWSEAVTYSVQPVAGDLSWALSKLEEAAGATAPPVRSHASYSRAFLASSPNLVLQLSNALKKAPTGGYAQLEAGCHPVI
jgi:hypothetical protein